MKSLKLVLAVVVLITLSQNLLAQHGEHGGVSGGMGGTGAAGNDSVPDMHRMMAMQATDEQARHYRAWLQATSTARTYTQQLHQATVVAAAYARYTDELQAAVANAGQGQQAFLNSLTPKQRSGLKERVQKAQKAQAEVSKRLKALSQAFSRGEKRSSEHGEKLDKALANWLITQREIASEMGIRD